MNLSDEHRTHLRGSCLTDETIHLARLYTETDPRAAARLLERKQTTENAIGGGPWLVFPVVRPGEAEPFAFRVRPDRPRKETKENGKERVVKYDQRKGELIVYFPPRTRESRLRSNEDLIITEGEKKALFADQAGFACLGLTGVENWGATRTKAQKARGQARVLAPAILDAVQIEDRTIVIAFDVDSATNPNVDRAQKALASALYDAGARSVRSLRPTRDASNPKAGIDDLCNTVREAALERGASEAEAIDAAHAHLREMLAHAAEVPREELTQRVKDLDALADAPVPDALVWPPGYQINRAGAVVTVPDEESAPKLVTDRPILLSRILVAPDGSERVEVVHQRAGRWKTKATARSTIKTAREIVAELSNAGADVSSLNALDVIGYLRDFERVNEERLPRINTVHQTGWVRVGDTWDFCAPEPIGGSALLFDREAARDPSAVAGLTTGGSIDLHRDLVRQVLDASDESCVAMCAALAAPLLHVLGASVANSFAVHLIGDSSRGKSTMLACAAGLYGDPANRGWLRSWNSTPFALEQSAATTCDLPFIVDESGAAKDASEIGRLIYSIANGASRAQGRKDGSIRSALSWRTIALSSGEVGLVPDDAGASGTRARIINIDVDRFGSLGAEGVDQFRARCKSHFGHVGRDWIRAVLGMDWSRVREGHAAIATALAAAAPNGIRARQASSWAALGIAEVLIRDLLGMKTPGRVESAFARAEESNETRPLGDVALERTRDWFAMHRSSFTRIVREDRTGWRTAPDQLRPRELFGHVCGSELWISPEALRSFFEKCGFSSRLVLKLWNEGGHLMREKESLQPKRAVDGVRCRFVILRGAAVGLAKPEAEDEDTDDLAA